MIRVQAEDFSLQVEYDKLREQTSAGAVVTFSGLVRDINQRQAVSALTVKHYPGMAEKSLAQIVEQAKSRWQIINCRVIHRIGEFKPSDQIVFVGVACEHRQDAFTACEFIMDALKNQALFWKKESWVNNKSHWLKAQQEDLDALNRWAEE